MAAAISGDMLDCAAELDKTLEAFPADVRDRTDNDEVRRSRA